MHRVYDGLCLTQTQALFDLVVAPAYVYSNYKHNNLNVSHIFSSLLIPGRKYAKQTSFLVEFRNKCHLILPL